MIMMARTFSLLRQVLWAATLASGFGTFWLVILLWLTTSVQEAWQGTDGLKQESLVVTADGTPLIRSVPISNFSLGTYRDLSGRPHDAPETGELLQGVTMPGELEAPGFFSGSPGWEQRLKIFVDAPQPTVNWFFVHDGKPLGAGYFVGYERISNRRVGYIGLNGFRSAPVPAAEWIPVRGDLIKDYAYWSSAPIGIYSGRLPLSVARSDLPPQLVYVPSGNRLRLVDLAVRQVSTVFEAPEPIESPGIPTLSSWSGTLASGSGAHAAKELPILVRTRHQIYTLSRKHNVIRAFAIPTEADRRNTVTWYEIGNGQAIVEFGRHTSTGEADNVTNLVAYQIASDGTIQNRLDVSLQTGAAPTNRTVLQMQVFLSLPSPASLVVVEPFFVRKSHQSYIAAVLSLVGSFWPSLLAALILASILAIMAWRRSRSSGLPKRERTAWAVFVLVFGFPAFVGFLICRRWPIRLACPTCYARPPRDRAACAECGTSFPEPSPRGIEVFA
jgi:hypothetical protein